MTSADPSRRTVSAFDGRTLCFAEWGDPKGFPVFSLHGTPGGRLNRHPDETKYAEAGARVVTYDRPGYGGSTRLPGRSVADCVVDVIAIADHLGIARFAVTGGSGGGPHSLAVAAALPDRVVRARCDVGVAPYGLADLDFFAGMDPSRSSAGRSRAKSGCDRSWTASWPRWPRGWRRTRRRCWATTGPSTTPTVPC